MKKVWHYSDTVPHVLNELQADKTFVNEKYEQAKKLSGTALIAVAVGVVLCVGLVFLPKWWVAIPAWTIYLVGQVVFWTSHVHRNHYFQLKMAMSSTRSALLSAPPVRPDIIVEVDISLIPLRTRIAKKLRSLTPKGRLDKADSDSQA